MAHQSQARNPFMLMIEPEVVLAAIENSERLGRLNRHLCRPLDRVAGPASTTARESVDDAGDDEADTGH
jgi:hypothetical protein